MINKVIGTIGSRFFSALLSLGIIIIISNQLGAKAAGTISLIILGISIVQMANSLLGGPALIYLVPRFDIFKLLVPSYIWALATSLVGTWCLYILNLVPAEFIWHVLFLSIILSIGTINLTILLGKEKVKAYNIISTLQVVLLIGTLTFIVFFLQRKTIISYIIALYVSYSFAMICAVIATSRMFKVTDLFIGKDAIRNLIKYGGMGVMANILQLFNYRLTYYFIEHFIGTVSLGIYSTGVQLSEGLWITGKSMSVVQYSRISNSNDLNYATRITLVFGKISFLATLLLLIVLLLIPHELFSFIFSKEFSNLPVVIISLAAGILFLSLSFSLSHFFSGIGKIHHNSISSGIGLIVTLLLGYVLIPQYGIAGAGITTSVAYFSIVVYQVIFFMKISNSKGKDLLLSPSDIKVFATELKNWIRKI